MSGDPGKTPGAFWDQRYDDAGYVFGQDLNQWMAENRALLSPGINALVPGDGEGRNGVWLAERGLNVTTIDASPVGVAKALQLAAAREVKIEAEIGDLRDWTPDAPRFDVVVLAFLHVNPADRQPVHQRVATALKPGGLLLLEGFASDYLGFGKGGPSAKEMMFTESGLRDDFEDMLDIEYLAQSQIELPSSERHGGRAVVMRLRARRKA
jgi:SAM-dependent methyltransferase